MRASHPACASFTVEEDPKSPGVWARYYEIGTNRPVFGDHDDEVHGSLSDISIERRTGYAWYGTWPEELLAREYPAWKQRIISLKP